MIKKEIIFAGFGGQGILTAGKFLAYAAWIRDSMFHGYHLMVLK